MEIFPQYHKIFSKDYDTAIKNAKNTELNDKKQRKQLEIGKSKETLANKQRDLQKLSSPDNSKWGAGMNEQLYEIYRLLRALGVVKSENQFSRDYLGRTARIFSWMKISGHAPALDVMLGVYNRLVNLQEELEISGEKARAELIDDTTDKLWEVIRRESLLKRPHSRKKHLTEDARAIAWC